MKILILGHWSDTGFGLVTRRLGEEFVKKGIDVRVLAHNHRGEPVKGLLNGRVWPADTLANYWPMWSSLAINGQLWEKLDSDDHWAPDQVLAIADMSGLFGYIGQMTNAWLSVPVWHYCPIEGDNLAPPWRQIWNQPGGSQFPGVSFLPVAMSLYGQKVLSEHIGRPVPMVYHGVDSDTFRPITASDPFEYNGRVLRSREDCKEVLGLNPHRKLVLRIDRLVERKRYDLQIRAMAEVFRQVPDVDLLMHCAKIDPPWNLQDELHRLSPEFHSRIFTSDDHDTFKGLTREGVAVMMNAADLYVSTTAAEGFGLALAESMSCGVPVVTSGWAAEVEVVGPGGICVPPLTDKYGEVVRYHSQYGMDWCYPDWRGFVEPIVTLLERPSRRRELGRAGRAHVVDNFSWTQAAAEFTALFATVANTAEPRAA